MGISSESVSFRGRFGDHFSVGDHFGVGIISWAVQASVNDDRLLAKTIIIALGPFIDWNFLFYSLSLLLPTKT